MAKKNGKKFNPTSRKEAEPEELPSVEELQRMTEIAYLRERIKELEEELYYKEQEYQKIARHVFILGIVVGMIVSIIIGVMFL